MSSHAAAPSARARASASVSSRGSSGIAVSVRCSSLLVRRFEVQRSPFRRPATRSQQRLLLSNGPGKKQPVFGHSRRGSARQGAPVRPETASVAAEGRKRSVMSGSALSRPGNECRSGGGKAVEPDQDGRVHGVDVLAQDPARSVSANCTPLSD